LCHGPNYTRTVTQTSPGAFTFIPAPGVDVVAVAQNVQAPNADMCSRCHLRAAGGPNYKHGEFPTPQTDVHLAAGFQCITCHKTEEHKIAGGGYMIAQEIPEVKVSCTNAGCHAEAPHGGANAATLNGHLSRVACQTCHIPLIARSPGLPTQMVRDWTQSVLVTTTGLYDPLVTKAGNLIPTYLWWKYPYMKTPPAPVGAITDTDARITPWKPMTVIAPFDAQTHTPLYIKAGVYSRTGDLTAAVNAGVPSQPPYSGSWEPHAEPMFFDAIHQVRPASEALACADCHSEGGRLDFLALGYPPDRIEALQKPYRAYLPVIQK
jgi:hypothetical protein